MSSSPQWSTRTFGNEDGLPRVPLPSLEDTCARFLEWCAPLLTPGELAATEAAVAAFGEPHGAGCTLQAALERYDASDGVASWLDAFWPARYLGRRDRIALNANFFCLFKDSGQQQVPRAAALIAAALSYKTRLDREQVAPVIQRGQVLSMEQNKFLFSTTRIPGPVQDSVRAPYTAQWPGPSAARHIVVFHRGNMFRLDVVGPEGSPHSVDELSGGLRAVMTAGATRAPRGTSVGHLTTMARADWAASRQALLACDPANADALDLIETALFCLSLEEFTPRDALGACDQLLHGDSANRWFDKAISFVVFANGTAGVNDEHSCLDGSTIISFVDELLAGSDREPGQPSAVRSPAPVVVEPIAFVLNDQLRAGIAAAGDAFASYAARTATTTVSITDFGGDRAKQLRISPDGFVQLAFQLAHRRAKGFVGTTYESVSTRHYRHGRTEAMRVVTPEIVRFTALMDDPGSTAATRCAALRDAAAKHVERAKGCQAGRAPEQHLWELQLIQQRRGAELGVTQPPALFASPGWLRLRDDYLSTSGVPSANIEYNGFGSTSANSIGVCYVLLPGRVNLFLSTPLEVAPHMYLFADRLRDAVRELRDLLAAEE